MTAIIRETCIIGRDRR